MTTRTAILVVLGALFILGTAQPSSTDAQVFPYMAPQAPEFDDRGRSTESKPARDSYPENYSSVITPPRPSWDPGNQSAKPSGPRAAPRLDPKHRVAPQAPEFGSVPNRTPYGPVRPGPAAPVATAPGPPPAAAPQRLDCSQFPMLIAQARSEAEMRAQAVQYLTCLVQSGWDQNTAKNHVSSVIESSYRLMR